jgi:ABC-type glutathione transport system ATPase component
LKNQADSQIEKPVPMLRVRQAERQSSSERVPMQSMGTRGRAAAHDSKKFSSALFKEKKGLSIRNINKSYGVVQAVKDITSDVHAGDFFTLLRTSGCGKIIFWFEKARVRTIA